MHIVGLDLGKRKSQICVLNDAGVVVDELRLSTTHAELTNYFASLVPARVLLEASTSSDWVARCIRLTGCEVVVGDPRFGPMFATRNRRIKTDQRDARALADALRVGAVRPVALKSPENRRIREALLIRKALIGSRAKLVNQARSICEREGFSSIRARHDAAGFVGAIAESDVPDDVLGLLAPALVEINRMTGTIDSIGSSLSDYASNDELARRFDSVCGVGPLTALAFKTTIDDAKRFSSSRAVASYVGLVPSEYSSGETRRVGSITKTGDWLLRSHLVQSAWAIMRSKDERWEGLRCWAREIAKRRGEKRAAVALARKLSRILFAMWRDGSDFDASRAAKSMTSS